MPPAVLGAADRERRRARPGRARSCGARSGRSSSRASRSRRPRETFSGESLRQVGAKDVHLLEVGPAHTRGDVLVYVPVDRTVFTGDIVFANAHPIIWAGPIGNWVRACDAILGMEVDTVVPGHGPLCGPETVRELRGYLAYIADRGAALLRGRASTARRPRARSRSTTTRRGATPSGSP